jgi:hypothetical protein
MYFTTNPNLYMSLFAISIFVVYMLVRLRIASIRATMILGILVNAMCMFLYSLSRGNPIQQAILVGTVLGIMFTIIPVGVAAVFQTKQSRAVTKVMPENKLPVAESIQ